MGIWRRYIHILQSYRYNCTDTDTVNNGLMICHFSLERYINAKKKIELFHPRLFYLYQTKPKSTTNTYHVQSNWVTNTLYHADWPLPVNLNHCRTSNNLPTQIQAAWHGMKTRPSTNKRPLLRTSSPTLSYTHTTNIIYNTWKITHGVQYQEYKQIVCKYT